MKLIALTQGKSAIVDDEDYLWLSRLKWYVSKHGNRYYASCKLSKRRHPLLSASMGMHRAIILSINGELKKDKQIDHINGNSLDNRRCNLREVTPSVNQRNTSGRDGTSQYRGVHFCSTAKKWKAQSRTTENKLKTIGYFHSEYDAARAYNKFLDSIKDDIRPRNVVAVAHCSVVDNGV